MPIGAPPRRGAPHPATIDLLLDLQADGDLPPIETRNSIACPI